MTYSIVARDPETGAFGVAVQSHWFSVGSVVPDAQPSAGAIATQANPDPGHRAAGIALLAEGMTADAVIARLLEGDPAADHRQIGVVDRAGRAAAYTGPACIAHAGQVVGDGYTCQANMMRSDAVWPAMAEGYESASGPFANRLLAALDAAEAAGGDIRGRQSSAILIVPAEGAPTTKTVDLRVGDHADPLGELRRLLTLHDAYVLAEEGDALLAIGDPATAAGRYLAAHTVVPENDELRFWAGLGLIGAGSEEHGLALLRHTIDADPGWLELLGRIGHVEPASTAALKLLRSRS